MILKYVFLFLICILFAGCEILPKEEDDFTNAKIAMEMREWFHAEHLLERYLNIEEDKEKRWEAWLNLIQATKNTGSRLENLRIYYENMLQEFFEDDDKKKFIFNELITLFVSNDVYGSATDTLNAYLGLSNLTVEERLYATTNLIDIYLKTAQFEAAENSLYDCLGLEIKSEENALCLYELADLKAENGEFKEAADLLHQALEMKVYPQTRGSALFLLGDMAERQGEYEKALAFFEQAKELYPNIMVVESRIELLGNLIKK